MRSFHSYDNIIFRYTFIILFIIFTGAFCTYWIRSQTAIFIYYTILMLFFYLSKNNVFWLAFYFIMISAPFGLFYGSDAHMIKITATGGINYTLFFPIITLLKYMNVRRKPENYLKRFYKVFLFYCFFLIAIGFVYGVTIKSVYYFCNYFSSLFLFLTIPVLINNSEDVLLFNRIIIAFSIIISLELMADIVFSGKITDFLAPSGLYLRYDAGEDRSCELIRQTAGIIISMYSIILSFYYLVAKNEKLRVSYLWIVIYLSVFFIFCSATRGWMIAAIFSLFAFLITNSKISMRYSIFIVLLVFIGICITPHKVTDNIVGAFERLATLRAISKGDMTANGTLLRITQRSPRVLSHFKESPIIGFGYSQKTHKYYDGHVANQSELLIGGVLGLSIIYGTLILFSVWLSNMANENRDYAELRGLTAIVIGLVAIIIIHCTSRSMISFYMPIDSAYMISMFFALINSELRRYNSDSI